MKKFNIKVYLKNWRLNNKEYMNLYYINNRKKLLNYQKKYRKRNSNKIRINQRNWYLNNKQKCIELHKKYVRINKEQIKNYHSKYYKKNKPEMLKKSIIYSNLRRKIDINFRLIRYLRKRIWSVLKGNSKSKSTMNLLGCSIEKLKKHIESKFKSRMNWSNYGSGWNGKGMQQWHIDHKIPCASFDLSKSSEQRKCFHYTNLQPLWAKENLSKNCKVFKK